MKAFAERHSWALLLAILTAGICVAAAVGQWAGHSMFNKTIVAGSWTALVFLQLAVQVFVALLASIAEGKAQDSRGAALFSLGVSLAALSALIEIPGRGLFETPEVLAGIAGNTMFGALACSASSATCGDVYRITGWLASLSMLALSVYASWRLRVSRERAISSPWMLVFMAAVGTSLSLLLVHEWQGAIGERISESASQDMGALALGAMVAFCLLHGLAAAVIAGIRRPTAAPFGSVNIAVEVVIFIAALGLLLGIVVLAVALVAASVLASGNLFDAMAAAALFLGQGVWAALNSIGAPSGVGDNTANPVLGPNASLPLPLLGTAAACLLLYGLRAHLRSTAEAVGTRLLSAGRWALAALVGLVAKRWRLLAIVGAVLLSFTLLPTEPPAPPRPPGPHSPDYADRYELSRVALSCPNAAAPDQTWWAFDSANSIAARLDGCRFEFPAEPSLIVVVGVASADDTQEGGFSLSTQRAERLAALAKIQFPRAGVVVAALGRETGEIPSGRHPDRFAEGRPPVALASVDIIPAPLKREPLSSTVAEALRREGYLNTYETCWLALHGHSSLPASLPYPLEERGCRWAR